MQGLVGFPSPFSLPPGMFIVHATLTMIYRIEEWP